MYSFLEKYCIHIVAPVVGMRFERASESFDELTVSLTQVTLEDCIAPVCLVRLFSLECENLIVCINVYVSFSISILYFIQ